MERGRKRGRPRTAALVAAVVLVTMSQGAAVAAPAAYPAATAPGAGTAATAARSAPAGPVAPAPGPGFASSFEEGDPQPDWTDTAEAVPAEAVPAGRGRRKDGGRKKASGTDGTVAFGIPGNVTDEVTAVRASAQNAAAGEVKEALFDGNVSSRWQVFARTGWIEFDLARPVGPVRYALTAAGDTAGRDPRDWTLRGSDDAKTWTTLDTRTGERFSKRLETKEYALGEGTAHRSHRPYRHYRFEITGNAGASRLQLAELHLSDGDTTPPPPSDMRSGVSRGPTWSPTDSANVGFTGRKALYYGGTHRPRGRAYSYNKVFDVDVPVTPSTTLSYVIFPSMSGSEPEYPATHASLDLAFTDGTYLSDLGAADQHGARLTPSGQAASGTLYPNQWNRKESRIGAVAAGRTVDRVLVAYDAPRGPAVFRGWVDDVRIGPGAAGKRVERPSDHVLTTRGTRSSGRYSRGNTFPATAVPHGFNFWSPMTNAGSTSWLYDYARGTDEDNLPRLQAFTASHEPSPWMGDRQTFQVMPSAAPGVPDAGRTARALPFRHENETARAHYYSVAFENGLRTEIAPTDHAALMRFTFPGDAASVLFDNVGRASGLALDPDNGIVTGWSDVRSARSAGATRMFVYGVFDAPVTAGGALPGGGAGDATGWFRFDAGADRTVNLRIATSLIGTDQARSNLEQEIAASDTLGSVRERAQRAWDRVLGVIEVEGASGDRLTTLYSNLYRLHLYPNSGFEAVTGTGTGGSGGGSGGAGEDRAAPVDRYASPFSPAEGPATPTRTGARIVEGRVYVNNGFWDTYRTTWPAYSLFTPDLAGEMADGFVRQYKDGGWISRWSSPGYADLMTGTSSDVAFADAFLKGVEFDAEAAYEAAVKNATVAPPDPGVGRKGLERSVFLGYTPTGTGDGMSWAIEGCLNDYGIARMAEELAGRTPDGRKRQRYRDESAYFLNRARNYVHLFDGRVGFFQGRDENGGWRLAPDAFDARTWGHDYTETNAWNMAFTVPQDGRGLANLYGGKPALAGKLDTFFSTPETGAPEFAGSYGGIIHEMSEARDVRMGMYGHSNQPSHHIAYMYDAAGQPWKTQKLVREALSRLYLGGEIGQGYLGDEDNGEMSAWYVFSALGFYPLVTGSPEYAVGSPLFTRATVHLPGGRDLVIEAPENSERNVYVQGLTVNGERWESTALPHSVLAGGGTIRFAMGPEPSAWGTGDDAAPTSVTRDDRVPDPLADAVPPGTAVTTGGGGGGAALADDTSGTAAQFTAAGIELDERTEAAFYTLTSSVRDKAPSSWVLKGSRDGTTWTVLDRRTDETFAWDRQTRVFGIGDPGAYTHYRLEPVGGPVSLAEIELLA